jgi:hypothetical protein
VTIYGYWYAVIKSAIGAAFAQEMAALVPGARASPSACSKRHIAAAQQAITVAVSLPLLEQCANQLVVCAPVQPQGMKEALSVAECPQYAL